MKTRVGLVLLRTGFLMPRRGPEQASVTLLLRHWPSQPPGEAGPESFMVLTDRWGNGSVERLSDLLKVVQ